MKCRHLDRSIQYQREHCLNSIDGLTVCWIHSHLFLVRPHFLSFWLSEFHNFPIQKYFEGIKIFGRSLLLQSPRPQQQYFNCIILNSCESPQELCSSSMNSDSKKNFNINLKKPNFLTPALIKGITYSLLEEIFYYFYFRREKRIKIKKAGVDSQVKLVDYM